MTGRKYFLFSAFFLFLSVAGVNAQFFEFGGGAGISNYSGDLERGFNLSEVRPGVTALIRTNLSNVVSLRYSLLATRLGGSDAATPIDPFAGLRNQSFSATLIDLDFRLEYYFLDYLNDKSTIKWSPFLTFGIGFFRMFTNVDSRGKFSKVQPFIPIGIGFKHLIGKRYSIGFETVLRKTFTDYLDNISSEQDQTVSKFVDPNFGNPEDKDWYLFAGFTFTYILYKIPCPFPYRPNSSILD